MTSKICAIWQDFSIRTDALQSIGIENWSFDVHYSAVRPILHKLSWLLGAAYLSRFRERGEKVSIITIDSDEYNDVMNRFGNVTIKDCISVILIDNYRCKILKEFQILWKVRQNRCMFSKTTSQISGERDGCHMRGEDITARVYGGDIRTPRTGAKVGVKAYLNSEPVALVKQGKKMDTMSLQEFAEALYGEGTQCVVIPINPDQKR